VESFVKEMKMCYNSLGKLDRFAPITDFENSLLMSILFSRTLFTDRSIR